MILLGKKSSKTLQAIADETFTALGLSGNAFVEVEYVNAEEIRDINKETRGIDKSTDVLSFPMLDTIAPFTKKNYRYDYDPSVDAVRIGSIIICREIAEEQAKEFGHSSRREQSYLFLHGLLHLLGYDHENEEDAKIMREKEELILGALGITR